MKKIMVRREKISKYLKSRGAFCPFCSSSQIEGTGRTEMEDGTFENEMRCLDCGFLWGDIYVLDGIRFSSLAER